MKFSNINLGAAVQAAAAPQSAQASANMPAPMLPPEVMAAPQSPVPQGPAPVPPQAACQMVPPAPAPLPPEAMAMPPYPEVPLPPAPPFMESGFGQVPPPPAPQAAVQAPAAPMPQSAPQQAPRPQAAPKKASKDYYDDSWMPLELRKNRSLMGLTGKRCPLPAAATAPAPSTSQAFPAPQPAPAAYAAPAAQAPVTPAVQTTSASPMSALVQMAREFEISKDLLTELSKCQLCPKGLKGAAPRDFFWIIQKGIAVGLDPTQALENIAIINGKACMSGDAMLALCMPHGDIQETFDEAKQTAVCTCRRPGKSPVTRTFSMQEAMDAGLLAFDKDGHALGKSREGWTRNVPWGSYPRRMLLMRARGFALRDAFPDVLKGIISSEEAMDYKV